MYLLKKLVFLQHKKIKEFVYFKHAHTVCCVCMWCVGGDQKLPVAFLMCLLFFKKNIKRDSLID